MFAYVSIRAEAAGVGAGSACPAWDMIDDFPVAKGKNAPLAPVSTLPRTNLRLFFFKSDKDIQILKADGHRDAVRLSETSLWHVQSSTSIDEQCYTSHSTM